MSQSERSIGVRFFWGLTEGGRLGKEKGLREESLLCVQYPAVLVCLLACVRDQNPPKVPARHLGQTANNAILRHLSSHARCRRHHLCWGFECFPSSITLIKLVHHTILKTYHDFRVGRKTRAPRGVFVGHLPYLGYYY
jgi:hypothetical protein